MSFDAIKQEAAGLDAKRRHELVAFLLAIDDQNNDEYKGFLAQTIDDKNPANWLTLEEMDRRLGISPGE